MATWMVSGVDRDTDAHVEIELPAPDEASALLAALVRGIYAARIRRVGAPAAGRPAEAAASSPAPPPGVAKTPARGPARQAAPNAAPTAAADPVTPTIRPGFPQPTRVAAVPRRVQVWRAPAELLPRVLADALYSTRPPLTVPVPHTPGTRR